MLRHGVERFKSVSYHYSAPLTRKPLNLSDTSTQVMLTYTHVYLCIHTHMCPTQIHTYIHDCIHKCNGQGYIIQYNTGWWLQGCTFVETKAAGNTNPQAVVKIMLFMSYTSHKSFTNNHQHGHVRQFNLRCGCAQVSVPLMSTVTLIAIMHDSADRRTVMVLTVTYTSTCSCIFPCSMESWWRLYLLSNTERLFSPRAIAPAQQFEPTFQATQRSVRG